MTSSRRLSAAGLALLAGLLAGPARAWDNETHTAILKTALKLSPAAEARLPADRREVVWNTLIDADPLDKDCVFHRAPNARPEAAAEAARLFVQLQTPNPSRTGYQRAQLFGRFLHFVGDCAVPTGLLSGRFKPSAPFITDTDAVFFRERRALAGPFEKAIRERGAEAQWADDNPAAQPAIFRLAVNLTIEALLLLPARPEVVTAKDEGPVLFFFSHVTDPTRQKASKSTAEAFSEGFTGVVERYLADVYSLPKSFAPPWLARGMRLAEWSMRTTEGGARLGRVLVFNNADTVASDVRLETASGTVSIPGVFPPRSMRLVEITASPVPLGQAVLTATPGGTPTAEDLARAIPTDWRLLIPGYLGRPSLDGDVREVRLGPLEPLPVYGNRPPPPPGSVGVALGPDVDRVLGDRIRVDSLSVKAVRGDWVFELTVTNLAEAAPLPMGFMLEWTIPGTADKQRGALTFDLGELAPGDRKTYSKSLSATSGKLPAFRVWKVLRPNSKG